MSATEIEEEGGEGYFASVSDLMVGILFVFLLMLTVFALNFRDAEDDQKVALARLIEAKEEARLAKQEADERKAEADAARKDAEVAQTRAEEERKVAIQERSKAETAKAEALAQRREAERQAESAKLEKIAADEQRQRNERLRALLNKAVAQMKEDLESRQRARLKLLTSLEDRLKKDGVIISVDPESGVLRLPEQLLFASGSSALEPTAATTLETLARSLSEVLPCFAQVAGVGCDPRDASVLEGVLVEGHSDAQGFREKGRALSVEASRDRNDQLSSDRSLSVFKELLKRGGLGDLKNRAGLSLLAVSAYGDRRPIATDSTPEGFQKNRRIDLRFLLSARASDELERLISEITPALQEGM